MKESNSSHGWDHVERVTAMAIHLATAEKADIFIVTTASLLHDIAREDENRKNGGICHAEHGGEEAHDFLSGIGLDSDRTLQVTRCIREHRFRNDLKPSTIESKVLYDADKLDSIGAIGIGRAFLFSGEVGARLHNPDIDISVTEAYSHEDTAYREYIVKLQHIKDSLLTHEGKRLAQERTGFMKDFFDRLQLEATGII